MIWEDVPCGRIFNVEFKAVKLKNRENKQHRSLLWFRKQLTLTWNMLDRMISWIVWLFVKMRLWCNKVRIAISHHVSKQSPFVLCEPLKPPGVSWSPAPISHSRCDFFFPDPNCFTNLFWFVPRVFPPYFFLCLFLYYSVIHAWSFLEEPPLIL